ncbi:hypothetical protein FPQ18DRAFT_301558 [Pyronema domesticum]|nr:hypothetical protein FPQ18DRAFT_301558 [Pyronema domesticum]
MHGLQRAPDALNVLLDTVVSDRDVCGDRVIIANSGGKSTLNAETGIRSQVHISLPLNHGLPKDRGIQQHVEKFIAFTSAFRLYGAAVPTHHANAEEKWKKFEFLRQMQLLLGPALLQSMIGVPPGWIWIQKSDSN